MAFTKSLVSALPWKLFYDCHKMRFYFIEWEIKLALNKPSNTSENKAGLVLTTDKNPLISRGYSLRFKKNTFWNDKLLIILGYLKILLMILGQHSKLTEGLSFLCLWHDKNYNCYKSAFIIVDLKFPSTPVYEISISFGWEWWSATINNVE